jgi:hypothetical protein
MSAVIEGSRRRNGVDGAGKHLIAHFDQALPQGFGERRGLDVVGVTSRYAGLSCGARLAPLYGVL